MKFTSAALFFALAATPASQAFVPATLKQKSPAFASVTRRTTYLRSTTEDDVEIKIDSTFLSPEQLEQLVKSPQPKQSKLPERDEEAELGEVTPQEARANIQSFLKQYEGQNGASVIYSKLQEHGVTVVNGFSGGAVLPLLDQFHEGHPRHSAPGARKPIRWITNSNESSAGHIAEGYAKAMPIDGEHKPVGVAIATSGPGVTNLITPLQDAICDGVPIVVLCGQAATVAPPDAFQSSPAVDLTKPCTKWSYQIKSAAELPLVIDYAFYLARNGRPGPVFVDLPKDLLNQVVTAELIQSFVDSNLKGSGTDFARLQEHRRMNGKSFTAVNLGYHERNLPFEARNEGDTFKLKPVKHSSAANTYHADHHPTNRIYKSEFVNGKASIEAAQGTLKQGSAMTKELTKMIMKAKKPIIIAGQGCNDSAAELKAFAEKLQIPVTTTLHALGCFDERSSLALNMLGMHGHPTPNFMVQESDLIICVGSRFDDRITGRLSDFAPEACSAAEEGRGGIIHVDVRVTENAKQVKPSFFVHSTGKEFLRTMNAILSENGNGKPQTGPWLQRMKQLQKDFPVKVPHFPTEEVPVTEPSGETRMLRRTRMSAQSVITELNRQLLEAGVMDDCIFTTGVGIHQMVAAQLITWTQPRQMLSSGSLGTMGVALGYSIGAKLANGKKIVIAVDGDGSFNMTFTELKTLAEQNIPVKILILDNDGQMMVEYWQRLFHDNRLIAVRNSANPDYSTLASAFGIRSVYCDCEEDIEEAMKEFLFTETDKPVVFHARIARTPCLPLVAPGQPLEDMILEDVEVEVDPGAAPS